MWKGSEQEFHQFLETMNSTCLCYKFTYEKENANSEISFLDILFQRKNNTLNRKVYRKQEYVPIFIPEASSHPMKYKVAAIRTLFQRAYKICSNKTSLKEEIDTLYQQFLKNGYSIKAIKKIHYAIKNKLFPRTRLKPIEEPTKVRKFIPINWYPHSNKALEEGLKKFPNTDKKIILAQKVKTLKDKLVNKSYNPNNTSGIYFCPIKENSGITTGYIVQTRRHIGSRIKEHKRDFDKLRNTGQKPHPTTSLISVVNENPILKPSWEESRIISIPKLNQLTIVEAYHILLHKKLVCNENLPYEFSRIWLKYIYENKNNLLKGSQIINMLFNQLQKIGEEDLRLSTINFNHVFQEIHSFTSGSITASDDG